MTEPLADPKTMAFEAALAELEKILALLEESIDLYRRGETLKVRCDELLKRAEARVETIAVGADGGASGLKPLDPE